MVEWHRWLNGHEFEQTPGDSKGQGSVACCNPWGLRVGHDLATEQQLSRMQGRTWVLSHLKKFNQKGRQREWIVKHIFLGLSLPIFEALVPGPLCCAVLCLVAQSCPTLRPHGLSARLLCPWGFSRQEYWSGLPCPPPGDLPNSGIEPRSLTLEADSLPAELPGKPSRTSADTKIYGCSNPL